MNYINNIDTEGGSLLIADATVAQKWRGTEGDGKDYDRASKFTDDSPAQIIDIDHELAIAWDVEGEGTVDVFNDKQRTLIVRAWLDDEGGIGEITKLAKLPLINGINIGSVEITSGILAILWSAESGECIESLDIDQHARPTGEMATDSSGLLIRIANGRYLFVHDEVEIKDDTALRCHIILQ